MPADSVAANDLQRLSRHEHVDVAQRVPLPPPRWKTRVVLPVGIVAAVVGLMLYAVRDALQPATPVRVVPVVVKTVSSTPGIGAITVQAPGWIEPDPFPISVSALTDGVVESVLVLEGEPVKAGQVVARLIDEDAKLALAGAEAELARQEAALQAATEHWENPVEHNRAVAVAKAAVAETQAELTVLKAQVNAQAAEVAELEDRLERNQASYARNAATELEVARTRFQLASARAILEAVQARKGVLEAQLEQRQAEVAAAQRNLQLRTDQAQALEQAKAEVALARVRRDEAQLALSRTEVRSPADGVVMVRLAQPGSKLMLGMDDPMSAHAVRLYDPQKLQVRVDVALADAAKVGVGQSAQIVVGVLPDKTFTGRVTRVVHEADLQKNTLQVKVAIDDPSPQLKPEMLARVRFIGSGDQAAQPAAMQQAFVPEQLIERQDDAAYVWVADEGRTAARRRRIEPGAVRQGEWTAVHSGVSAGDLVITNATGLRDGERIKIEEGHHAAH